MSYTPTEWKTGDIITAYKLNNMESGIVNAPGVAVFEFEVITDNDNQVVTDVTVAKVANAYKSGKLCVARIWAHTSEQTLEYSSKEDFIFGLSQNTDVSTDRTTVFSISSGLITIRNAILMGFGESWSYSESTWTVNTAS